MSKDRPVALRSNDDIYFSRIASELQSDLDLQIAEQNQQRNAAQFALDRFGDLIDSADNSLNALLENDNRELGAAIVRGCRDLADAVGHMATQIDQQSDEERHALAQACIDDAQQTLFLLEEGRAHGSTKSSSSINHDHLTELSSNMNTGQVASAIQAAGALLRDVESTLRTIDQRDAEELADATLTLAHLFVLSLQSVHDSTTAENLVNAVQTAGRPKSTTTIEMLDEEEGDNAIFEDVNGASRRHGCAVENESAATFTQPNRSSDSRSKSRRQRMEKLRILWPPLGPAVSSACSWGQDAVTQRPLFAVALGITLWPVAVLTAVIGTPVVVADSVLQNVYRNFEDTPVIQGLEQSAAQLYQGARLSLICGKLVGRQTLRVASRQVERHGGVGKIATDIGVGAVDRVTHPVETIGMAWNGLVWGCNTAVNTWQQLSDRSERDETAQRLQQ